MSTLKTLLEQRLGVELPGYEFWLQNTQPLEPGRTLVEQCVQGEGLVQVSVQIQTHLRRINIVDVLKPADEYVQLDENITEETSQTVPIMQTEEQEPANQEQESEMVQMVESKIPENRGVIKWVVDPGFKKEQERLKIPADPHLWLNAHVRHWIQWAVRHFNLPHIKLQDWNISGKDLCKLSLKQFQEKVPRDPGDIFWTHLELLRKCKFVAVVQKDKVQESPEQERQPRLMKPNRVSFFIYPLKVKCHLWAKYNL